MNDTLKKQQDEMIARAEAKVQKMGVEFNNGLTQRVNDIETAIHKNNLEDIKTLTYNLESEAATFGWHRITRICKWLRRVFSGDYGQKPQAEDVLKALTVLKTIASDPHADNEDRDMNLFKGLYPVLAKIIPDI